MAAGRRLLLLLPWLALGGADKFNLDLLRCLRARGWDARVATTLPAEHPWRPAFEALAPVADLGALPAAERPGRALAAAAAADVVLLSGSQLAYDLLPYLRACLPGVALVDYNHMEQPDWRDGGYPRASLDRAPQLDLQVVSSAHLRAWMLARGADPARVHVCYTGVDAAEWDPARHDRAALRRRLGLAPDEVAVLFAGRLEAQKRPAVLAATAAAVCRAEPRARFLIAGDGAYAGFLRAALRRRGLAGRASMLGPVSNAGVRELLAASDIFLLPSAHEGISLALYEAMAMGVAPVAAAVGGQAELVTPECGYLVPVAEGELDAYVAILAGLIADPARRRAMGAAARERVARHFPLSSFGPRMAELFERAAELRRVEPRQAVGRALARELAVEAVEHARVEQVVDVLWARQQALDAGQGAPARAGAMARAAVSLRDALRPAYHAAVRGGLTWLVPLKDRLRAAALRALGR